jgi:hypothetical protein
VIEASSYRTVHPFPARMAPEIAFQECSGLSEGSIVVDPMVGSGTTVHAAARAGCRAIGADVDPLAVLMTRVRTTPIDSEALIAVGTETVQKAKSYRLSREIRAIDADPETRRFVDYWFAGSQQYDLRALAILIEGVPNQTIRSALWVAFSRLIVTKDKGASLGRDVSHSRPHKVRETNDFNVLRQFEIAIKRLASVLTCAELPGHTTAIRGDARFLSLGDGGVDMVITSPPYLNAIDYLRGHRLSLVWLGFTVAHIRRIRGESVGAERGLNATITPILTEMRSALGGFSGLESRYKRIVDRYMVDLVHLYREQARVLRRGGTAVTVIGNSAVRGNFLQNDAAATAAAEFNGLRLNHRYERPLPTDRRYLPPPQLPGGAALQKRMRTETVLKFTKS